MAESIPTVLVADDQPDVIAALRLLLRTAGFDAQGAASVEDVRTHLASRDFDAVLMDLNYARDTTSGTEGLDLISDLHARLPQLPLIAMTGWANVETAVEAMRRGARGYIPKPWNNEALVQVLRAEIDHARTSRNCGRAAHGFDAIAPDDDDGWRDRRTTASVDQPRRPNRDHGSSGCLPAEQRERRHHRDQLLHVRDSMCSSV